MEQHPVPQHIASFQFKLFGNLTTRQFVTLAIPLSLAALIFFSSIPTIIRLPLSFIVGIFAFVIALVPIGGKPFHQWVVAFVKAVLSPTQRIWIKEKRIPEFLALVVTPPQQEEAIPQSVTIQGKEKLAAYLKSLPKENLTSLDVQELRSLEKLNLPQPAVTQTPAILQEEATLPSPIIWPAESTTSFGGSYNYQMSLPQTPSITRQPLKEQAAVKQTTQPKVASYAKPFILPGIEKKLANPQIQKPKQYSEALNSPAVNLASETNYAIENIIPIRIPNQKIRFVHGIGKTRARKLHFAPPPGFDLSKLPIRGERRFEISEELKKRFHLEENVSKIAIPKAAGDQKIRPLPIIKRAKIVPKSTVNKKAASQDYKQPIRQKTAPPEQPVQFSVTYQKQSQTQNKMPTSAQIIPLTSSPNVISGQVTNAIGIPQEGVVLVLHDANNIPVRALKTSKLGQFLSVTPLANGSYTIEIESETAKFKPVMINLKGEILPPLAIRAEEA